MLERLTVGPLGENAYIIIEGDACAIVDPGDEAERILALVDSRSLSPRLVVETHGHLDHSAALPDLRAAWTARGLSVPLAVHASDAAYFGAQGEETNRRLFAAIRGTGYFRHYWRPLPAPDIILAEGDELPGFPYRVIHTPGHSAGSICLYCERDGILVSGDTLFRDGLGRTDGPDSDYGLLMASLSKLFALPSGTKVFPGHGEETSIGRESAFY